MSEQEKLDLGSFERSNATCMRWYLANKEECDLKEIEVQRPGQGIKTSLQDEPLLKFSKIRPLVTIQK
jgi:hypothetical protein